MPRPSSLDSVRRSWLSGFARLALAVAIGIALPRTIQAQGTDVIRGRVTNTEGLPLPGVRVTATSIPGNVTREIRTNNQGSFQIAFPNGTGDYIMGYALIGYNFRQFEIKRVADEDVLIADARLSVVQLDTIVSTASNQQRVNRNQQTPDVSGTERAIATSNLPPELQGDIAAMAASLPGVTLIPGLDGQQDGFSVLGLGADQNSVTLNGMQTGGANLPRDAQIQSSLSTSPYDGSRGGFSGGNFNIRPGSGSNFRTRGMSLLLNTPQLEWTDRAAQAVGTEYTGVSLGGLLTGPISYNKSFYNVSYQLGRQMRDNLTLLNASALGFQTYGIAQDSVNHFMDILRLRGVPTAAGPLRSQRYSDNGSVMGNFDFSPPTSSTGQSISMTMTGNWSRQSPVGGGATQLESASGDRVNYGGNVQLRHSGYVKMVLSESQLGFGVTRDHGDPYLQLPSGRVRVNSVLADGASGVQNLAFGGNQGLSSSSRSVNTTFMNTLSWFDNANRHRIKLGTELNASNTASDQSANLLGTFTFNSLADLESGLPASFTRTLTARRRSTGQLSGAMSLTDSYRRNPDLQIQYSLRVEGGHFTATPAFNPEIDRVFGLRNDRLPSPITISPRIGFSQTLGSNPEISAFAGAARAPRAVLRAGIGVYANGLSSGQITSALDNTGLPGGAQQITCTGPAVPTPDWIAYATNAASVPTECADGTGGTLFSNTAPNVTVFARNWRPQRSVRANTSWNGSVLDARYMASLDATYSLNLNQQRSVDLNFSPVPRFTLADEGRPIYVQQTSIEPITGGIASRDARVTQDFSRVSEIRSDLQSRTAQLTLRLSPIPRGPVRFTWSAAYTYSYGREQVSGFSSTAGNPVDVYWARSAQGPHSFNYNLGYNLLNAVRINWNGVVRSGSAYTPVVAGDINGDGYFNDRAFIYSATAADPAVADGMRQLLAGAPAATRECLESQLGKIASRNSCHGPWSSTASLSMTLDRAKFRMPQRANVQFSLSNPIGAADLAVNGSGHLKGWGQNVSPDPSLLYVRGFDPTTGRFKYEVNQRFGATRPDLVILRQPVVLTTSMKFDFGAMRERQTLAQQLGIGRTLPGTRYPETLFRSVGVNSVSNPMSVILRQQDSLHLTSMQADSIAAMNRRYNYRSDSLWAPVSRYFASLPEKYH
ncbi:MAG TPA: TonB-dependent receptor, partial [Gemmatimonadaceae bacterium]|nr:TonB-dependent receptor [Gemmatimonadaceae bacterium]